MATINTSERGGSYMLILFGAVFTAFPGIMLFSILSGSVEHDFDSPLQASLFISIFILVGLGIMGYGFYSLRAARHRASLAEKHRDAPWMTNPAWARGRIKDSNALTTILVGAFALIWNGISWPTLWMIYNDPSADKAARLIILLFPLVGLGVLTFFIYQLMRWLRFGTSDFEMAEVPGVIGGTLGGIVHTKVNIRPTQGFRLTLQCVRKRITGSGKNQSTHESVLWEDETILEREALAEDPRRSALPVFFAIPYTCEPTQTVSPRESIYWRLTAAAQLSGVDYKSCFVVPVYKTADSRPDHSGSAPRQEARPQTAPTSPAGRNYQVQETSAGIDYHFAGAGSPLFAIIPLIIGGIMSSVAIVMWLMSDIPIIFPIIFGLFGLIVEIQAVSMLLNRTRIQADPGGLSLLKRRLTGTRRTRIPASDLKTIDTIEGMSVNGVPLYNIQIQRHADKPLTIHTHIKGLSEARSIADSLARHTRLQR